MNESIFSRLFRYRQTEKISPKENYLTEMLCWLINNCPTFAKDYLALLAENNDGEIIDISKITEITAKTQVSVSEGFIDMVIDTDEDLFFICEHKVDSDLLKDQLGKYRKCQHQINNEKKTLIVLVTKSTYNGEQVRDISLTWKQVYDEISKEGNIDKYDDFERLFIEQFLLYLTEEGMGMRDAITTEGIKYYEKANSVPTLLKGMFNEIKDEIGLKFDESLKGNIAFKNILKMSVNKRWGRVGIDCFDWDPISIFAGAILDNKDHKLKDFDQPKFVIMIDCLIEKNEEQQKQDWFKNLMKRLENNRDCFNMEKASEIENKWRLLILKKPLADVIKGDSYDEQKESLKKEVINGIKLILDNCK